MLEHDIADKKVILIIAKFLEAGVMDNGIYSDTIEGTPQGNGASPMLANIFLHYVLDNWFDVVIRKYSSGECYMVRYADDFICCFPYPNDAEWFVRNLRQRYAKYGLSLAEEKTKILEFGRYAERRRGLSIDVRLRPVERNSETR